MISPVSSSSRRLTALLVIVVLAAGACASTAKKEDASGSSKVIPPASIEGSTTQPSQGSATTAAPITKAKVASPGAYAVGVIEKTYVDTTRKTKRNGKAAALPERTLPTITLYPATGSPGSATATAGAKALAGPWPFLVFSHGVTGMAKDYSITLRALASAGYVVVAPDYPLSKRTAAGGATITDVAEQTHDVAFLIDQLLAASKTAGGPLAGRIDPTRIGLVGHSLGAITSLGAGFNACCSDPRVRAVAEWAGIFFPLQGKGKVAASAKGRPLLILHGDADGTVNYRYGQAVYRRLGPPTYFITLPGAGHVPPYLQGVQSPQSKVVTLATVDFLDRYLKGDEAGIDRLHQVVADAGKAVATEQERVS